MCGFPLSAHDSNIPIKQPKFSIFNAGLPDTLFTDSTNLHLGDTVAIYAEGADSVIILYEDSISGPDSVYYDLAFPTQHIYVSLSSDDYPVQEGVYGINISDMFEPGHGNINDNDNYLIGGQPDPWTALVALAPKTIRVFSGSGSKFMHPLGSKNVESLTYGGYGFNIEEIVRYFNSTDGELLGVPTLTEIEDNMTDGICDECDGWIDFRDVEAFEEFYKKFQKQQANIPPYNKYDYVTYPNRESQPLYINQLIELIKQIEDGNPGHQVDLIYCVNILSEPASVVLETIEYLRDNEIHNVNVVGVELGNEVYFKFYERAIDFFDFFDYWNFIHGYNTPAMADLLSTDMYSDHDYISTLKAPGVNVKIGLPAANLKNCGEEGDYPLITDEDIEMHYFEPAAGGGCDCGYPQWNLDMATTYGTTIGSVYQYDAIILHNYYTPTNSSDDCPVNTNWRDIMLGLQPGYDPLNPENPVADMDYPAPSWSYAGYGDSRLVPSFYGITGKHYPTPASPLKVGNFKEFTRDRIDNVYQAHAPWLLFNAGYTGPEKKEIWVTEYNLLDEIEMPGPYAEENNDVLQPFESAVVNSFSHAVMLNNWFFWHLKSAYDPAYRPDFLTRTTLQNFLSGSSTSLMIPSNKEDRKILGISTCAEFATNPAGYNIDYTHYIRKINYYAPLYWRTITDKHLRYLKTTTEMYVYNDNVAPTFFIDVTAKKLYIFVSNVKYSNQVIGIDPGDLGDIYGPGYSVDLDVLAATGHFLDAEQLYSGYGNSKLYSINDAYQPCNTEAGIYGRMSSFTNVTSVANTTCPSVMDAIPGSVCVSVPGIAFGYIEIPFTATPRLGEPSIELAVFPNPTSNDVTVFLYDNEHITSGKYTYEFINVAGSIVQSGIFNNGEKLQLNDLPNGIYALHIYDGQNISVSEKVVVSR